MSHHHAPIVIAKHWADGGAGAEELAQTVVEVIEKQPRIHSSSTPMKQVYGKRWKPWRRRSTALMKSLRIPKSVHRSNSYKRTATATIPSASPKPNIHSRPDPLLLGAPEHHEVNVREVRLATGAEFVVFICGNMLTMPGLPKRPAAEFIDIDDSGKVVGLF